MVAEFKTIASNEEHGKQRFVAFYKIKKPQSQTYMYCVEHLQLMMLMTVVLAVSGGGVNQKV